MKQLADQPVKRPASPGGPSDNIHHYKGLDEIHQTPAGFYRLNRRFLKEGLIKMTH
ncbi:MAG TPA: hypothetical protein VH255_10270 [Verrucomicrobiae bacterium]|nr:hypothetical protein [Verrucomicrobiae bacterium]